MAGYIGSKAVLLSTTAAEVSGDADIGGSVLVDTIKADNGTTALTIDSSGNVTSPVSIGNAGSIVQTVSATSSTGVVLTTATTWTNVNPTVAITPKFSSSKILVIHSGSMMSQAQGGNVHRH